MPSPDEYVSPPKFQDLSSWPPRDRITNVKEMWEISAPPDNSLYWSLVLSFIIASPENSDWFERLLGNDKEIKELMQKKKIEAKKLDSKSIKKQVMNFNPFKNQHSFYRNKDLIEVFRLFSLRLKRTANNMRRGSDEWGDKLKLKAATKLLKCCIEVYETNSEGNMLRPKIHAPVVGRNVMVLFKHSGICKKITTKQQLEQNREHKVIDTYAFGMSLDHVVPLRRDALGHILKRTDISQQIIREMQQEITGSGHFLISLLVKDSRRQIVPSIYASPYIAWKLDNAGFITDPCSLEGIKLSAFGHCMGHDSTFLLHVLYEYASNSFLHPDKTTRNPDPEILRALQKIGTIMQNDCSKTNDFSIFGHKKSIAIKCHKEILAFNEYQRRVIEDIAHVPENCSPQINQTDFSSGNLTRRIKIISSLLEFYPKYFYYPNVHEAEDSGTAENKNVKFKDFLQHSEYYENLDNYSCLLFFDNFLFLDLPADIMNPAVQTLFLTVFSYKLFPKCLHGVHCNKHDLTPDTCPLRVIPFIFRSKFLERAKAVQEHLNRPPEVKSKSPKHQLQKEKDPNSVLTQVTSGLKDLPEIKDEFVINRLKKYLHIATSVTISDVDIKGVLNIERALQVIGETLNTSECSSVIGHLLCSSLSKCAIVEFFRIRNHCLSKYRSRVMQGKLNLEKEILRFKEIQNVIKDVHFVFQSVYASQVLRISYYMVDRGFCESKNIGISVSKDMEKERNGISHLLANIYTKYKDSYCRLTKNLLDYIEREAEDKECNKFQKIGQISTLKFLFDILASQCDELSKREIFQILQDLDILKNNFESKANETKRNKIETSTLESQKFTKLISDLRKIAEDIFSDVKAVPSITIDHSVIQNFFNNARNDSWFNEKEMSTIKKMISKSLQLSRESKAHLEIFLRQKNETSEEKMLEILEEITERMQLSRETKASLELILQEKGQLSEKEARQHLNFIFASKKDKNYLSTNLIVNPKTALKALLLINKDEQDVFMKNSDDEDDMDCLLKFSDTDEGHHVLLKMDFSNNVDLLPKVLQFMNRRVNLLLDRIHHLKSILIDEDEEILNLWNWGKSEAIKAHTRYLMCQRYLREDEVRGSLEMLLFDCMNILKSKKSLKRLWSKANDLFSGVSLRDVLSHGSTILEIVGGYLDNDDLPSHFIDKMLELIEDGDSLKTLSGLWEKERTTDLKQFETMLNSKNPSLRGVQKWMEKRPGNDGGWKDYLLLLPFK